MFNILMCHFCKKSWEKFKKSNPTDIPNLATHKLIRTRPPSPVEPDVLASRKVYKAPIDVKTC